MSKYNDNKFYKRKQQAAKERIVCSVCGEWGVEGEGGEEKGVWQEVGIRW